MAPPRKPDRWLLMAVLAGVALTAMPAIAVEWERLVMPGPVISGHADIEKECRSCHAPFARDEQRQLCLDCHDKIATDISTRRGFHFRYEPARTAQCRNCHAEHEGRDADVVRLSVQTFDHSLTDYPLRGAHTGVSCTGCHQSGAKHREAPADCAGCHADDDIHRDAMGHDCAACHTEASWTTTTFDHTAATNGRYPLTGAHEKVQCDLCHAGQRYKETPTECVACHRIDDVHGGQRGLDCQQCHGTLSWKKTKFDHLREAGFALTAGHGGLDCQACHAGNDFRKTAGRECVDCHRSDDVHQGRNGAGCRGCHQTTHWRDTTFDHGRDTKFPLSGAHATLDCIGCHKGAAAAEKLDPGCAACHRADDAHKAALGNDCAACHTQEAWTSGVRFDHDLTGFPLVGLHATTACESCHIDKRFAGTASRCVDCHRAADAHTGGLGADCAECHNPNDWRIWTFDHALQAAFALEGAHADAPCNACHARPPGKGRDLPRDCGGCHRGDDVHSGQFGSDCARCHNTRAFSGARRAFR